MGCSLHVPRGVADVDDPAAKPAAAVPKIMVMVVHHRDNWYDKPNPLALKLQLPSSPPTPIAASTLNCPSLMSLTPKRRFTNARSSYPPIN